MTDPRQTSVAREAERGVRYGIVAVFVVGLHRRDLGAVVNAFFALVLSYLPGVAERLFDVEFRAWQRLYTVTALLTHAAGMLGPYEEVWWWDHLTHTHSASVLGGVVHALARRRGRDPRPRVLAVVVGLGVLWELVEYVIHAAFRRVGLEPILVPYGRHDTLYDLLFDLVGAVLVLAFGDRLLDNFHHGADGGSA